MKLRGKILAAFLVVIVIFTIMGAINYVRFDSMSNNVDEIVDRNAPAAELIRDMRIALGWMFAAHSELVEGADAYKSTIAGGGSIEEAQAAAEISYTNATTVLSEHHEKIDEAYDEFEALGYFKGAEAEEMNALIGEHEETVEYFEQLERDYRATDWEAGEETMELLDASAEAADEALEQVEGRIDLEFVELNEETKDTADSSKTLILVLLIVGIVVSIVLALIMASIIVGPVKELTEVANDISLGKTDLRVPEIKSSDEIGELSKSFGRMVTSIKIMMMEED